MADSDQAVEEWPLPLGRSGDTGGALGGFDDALSAKLFGAAPVRPAAAGEAAAADELAAEKRALHDEPSAGAVGDIDPNNIAEAGWALVFARDWPADRVAAVKEALAPLIGLRQAAAGPLFRTFEGEQGYVRGEDARRWLNRHNVDIGPVDPGYGVPFYLLLIGGPQDIAFSFQYELDVFWAVGRLAFDAIEDYATYARNVVMTEKPAAGAKPRERAIALFAPKNDLDRATELFHDQVALPLANGEQRHTAIAPLAAKRGYAVRLIAAEAAKRAAFEGLVRGDSPHGRPGIVFSGSHGVWYPAADARFARMTGSLVCQDWPGTGKITDAHVFSAEHVSANADLLGAIFFVFACYGAGWPQLDDFESARGAPVELAPQPGLAALPAALLKRGALAVIGHVDRAWATSFQNRRGIGQTQRMRDVLERIARGDRIGQATDQFNVQWAAFGNELAERTRDREHGLTVSNQQLANLWVSRNDARNYVVLGDPAVQAWVSPP